MHRWLPGLVLAAMLGALPLGAQELPRQVAVASVAERWVWERLRAGEVADLGLHCALRRDAEAGDANLSSEPIALSASAGNGTMEDDARWRDSCRQVSARFLEWLLTGPQWRVAPTHRGVWIVGARVADRVDLTNAEVKAEVGLARSRFEAEILLDRARFEGLLSLYGSAFLQGLRGNALRVDGDIQLDEGALIRAGGLDLGGARVGGYLSMSASRFEAGVTADSMRVGGSMFMSSATVVTGGEMRLVRAQIGGNLDMSGSRFEAGVNGNSLRVRGSMFSRNGTVVTGGEISLIAANIAGNLDMSGSRFEAGVNANALRVEGMMFVRDGTIVRGGALNLVAVKIGGSLEMDGSRFEAGVDGNSLRVDGYLRLGARAIVTGGELNLVAASVGSIVDMSGSRFEAGVNGNSLRVGGSLFLNDGTVVSGKELALVNASIGSNLEMSGSRFEAGVDGGRLRVGDSLFLRHSTFEDRVEITNAEVGSLLDLANATFAVLDLSGTEVKGDLRLAWEDAYYPRWTGSRPLILRNTRVAALQDGDGAWPNVLDLQGFTYERLGGAAGAGQVEMLRREGERYAAWLARDPAITPQPYRHLASLLRSAGERDKADAILVAYRDRERAEAWRKCGESVTAWWHWGLALKGAECREAAWLSILRATIGYGIGDGPFRIFWWVLIFTVLGAVVLCFVKPPGPRGLMWSFGASLDHLLPIIHLNKEFDDYFDDPKRERLYGWQLAYFAGHALVGYLLASFLVAGLAGLTQVN